jgi:anti-sigma regulatory factor (Ser/Thr protein kinase)
MSRIIAPVVPTTPFSGTGDIGDRRTELTTEKMYRERLEEEIQRRQIAEEENARLRVQLQDASEQQWAFLRNVLSSVTEGRLNLCFGANDLPTTRGEPLFALPLTTAALKELRQAIRQAAATQNFPSERTHDLVTAAHEAAMNAVVHANGGITRVYASEEIVQVWISDEGKGIAVEHLPQATLERGYSSVGTLGQGFWLILKTADRIWLWTCPNGTTVVLEQERTVSQKRFLSYE